MSDSEMSPASKTSDVHRLVMPSPDLTMGDIETLEEMIIGQWYYMVGRNHSENMDRLVEAGFIERGPNPVGPWPAYRKKAEQPLF